MPRFLRRFLSNFILSREKRHAFADGRMSGWKKQIQVVIIGKDGTEKRIAPHAIPGLILNYSGENNKVVLHEPFSFYKCEAVLSDGAVLHLGQESRCVEAKFFARNGGQILLGQRFTNAHGLEIYADEVPGIKVQIGNDCLFSFDIVLRSGDGHAIMDAETGDFLNKARNIIIGDHVWMGYRTSVLKGGRIPSNCIVGAGSIITKAFEEENSIYAGAPAKKVNRKPVTWRDAPVPF